MLLVTLQSFWWLLCTVRGTSFFPFSHSTASFRIKLYRWCRQLLKGTGSRKQGSSWWYSMCNKGAREGLQGTRAYRYSLNSHHKDGYLSDPRKGWWCGWFWTTRWWLWRFESGSGLIEAHFFTSFITNRRFQPRHSHRAHRMILRHTGLAAQQVLMLKLQWHVVI